MVQLNFDATNVAPAAPAAALETGWYPSNIISTEMKKTKDQLGAYLEITFRSSAGPSQGRTLKSRLNLQNNNQQAVDIAYSELSAICHAVGKLRVATSEELHGGPLEIYVKKAPRNDAPGEFGNNVAGYRAIGAGGSAPGFSGAAGSQATAAPAWAAPVVPAQPAYAPPVTQPAVASQPAWAPSQPAAQPAAYAPQPPAPAAPAAPAGAGSVPPWAR